MGNSESNQKTDYKVEGYKVQVVENKLGAVLLMHEDQIIFTPKKEDELQVKPLLKGIGDMRKCKVIVTDISGKYKEFFEEDLKDFIEE